MHLPRFRFTLKALMGVVIFAAIALYIAFEDLPADNFVANLLIGGIVFVAVGAFAGRYPWGSLPVMLIVWVSCPQIDHGTSAAMAASTSCFLGWLIGAPLGSILRDQAASKGIRQELEGMPERF